VCVRFEVSWLLDLFFVKVVSCELAVEFVFEKVVRCCKRVECQVTCMKEGRKEGKKQPRW